MTEWTAVALSDVVDRVTTKNTDGAIDNVLTVSAEHGLIAQDQFFNRKIAAADTSGYSVVAPGQFVYNKSSTKGAPFGTVARNRDFVPGIVSPLYFVFEAKGSGVCPEFLELALNSEQFFASLRGRIREGARAHGALNVRLGEFYDARLALPPLPVQERIVEVIEAVDGKIAALRVEAVRASAIAQRLLDDEYISLAETAPSATLQSLLEDRLTYGVVQPGPEVEGGIPLIRAQDFSDGTVRADGVRTIDPRLSDEYARSRVRAGDLLMVLVGRTGTTAVVPPELDGANIARALGRLRFDSTKVSIDYMVAILATSHVRERLALDTNTTVQPTLNLKALRNLPVPVPESADQERIASKWTAADNACRAVSFEADRLGAVRARLLSGLLNRHIEIGVAEEAVV